MQLGFNTPPLGVYNNFDTPSACGGVVHSMQYSWITAVELDQVINDR